MLFRFALLRAAHRADISFEERRMLREVILWPRRRIDGEVLHFDDLVEEHVVAELQAADPALLAAALPAGMAASTAAGELVGQIDWAKLLDWLATNLPKIIELIASLIALF